MIIDLVQNVIAKYLTDKEAFDQYLLNSRKSEQTSFAIILTNLISKEIKEKASLKTIFDISSAGVIDIFLWSNYDYYRY